MTSSPDLPTDTELMEKTVTNIQSNRTKMAMVHFIFSQPKYSISLYVFLASLTYPLPAPQYGFTEPLVNFRTLLQRENLSYRECVQSSAIKLGQQLQDVATHDKQLLDEAHHFNRLHILKAQKITKTCTANTQKARQSLMQWESNGMTLPWTTSSNVSSHSCTAQQRNQTGQFLGENFQRYEDQASDTMKSYVDENESSLGHVVAYAEERFAYDLKYFVTDRVQPALDYLAEHTAKIQTIAVAFELDLSLLEGKFRETLVSLETLLEKTKHHIDVLQERLEAYRISINAFYAGYADLYHRMELTIDFAHELAIPGITFPGFMDMTPIPVAEFFLPTAPLNWPELELDYQAIHDLLDETAQECIEVMLEMLETLQAQANRHLRGAMQEIAEALVDILELKDYHPPKYQGSHDSIDGLEEELEHQSEKGKEMKGWMDTMLEKLVAQALDIEADEISIPDLPKANYSYANDGRGFDIWTCLSQTSLSQNFLTSCLCGFLQTYGSLILPFNFAGSGSLRKLIQRGLFQISLKLSFVMKKMGQDHIAQSTSWCLLLSNAFSIGSALSLQQFT